MSKPRSSYPDPSLTERTPRDGTPVVYRLALLVVLCAASWVVVIVVVAWLVAAL